MESTVNICNSQNINLVNQFFLEAADKRRDQFHLFSVSFLDYINQQEQQLKTIEIHYKILYDNHTRFLN